MLLNRFHRKGCGLLFSLSLIPRKRHPFTDYGSSRIVLWLHVQIPSSSYARESSRHPLDSRRALAPQALDLQQM
jgi:hypothetical protein